MTTRIILSLLVFAVIINISVNAVHHDVVTNNQKKFNEKLDSVHTEIKIIRRIETEYVNEYLQNQ